MIGIIIFIIVLVIIAILFSRKAVDKNRNPYLWGAIGIFSAFILPIILLKIILFVNHEWFQEFFLVTIGYVILSFVSVCSAYYILEKLTNPIIIIHEDDNLLDSDLD